MPNYTQYQHGRGRSAVVHYMNSSRQAICGSGKSTHAHNFTRYNRGLSLTEAAVTCKRCLRMAEETTVSERIDIPQHPNYHQHRELRQKPDTLPCIVCGLPCENPQHYVRVFWGGVAVTQREAEIIISKEGTGGDCLIIPLALSA